MTKNIETSGKSIKPTAAQPSLNGRGSPGTPPRTELQGASIDDLSTRLGAIQGVNEDMATFIAHNWQRFVGGLVVVLLGVVLYYQYKNAQDSRTGEASQRFEVAAKGYADLTQAETPPAPNAPPDDPADSQKATVESVSEQLRSLQSSHADSVYGKFAGLYAAQIAIEAKNFPAAADALSKFNTSRYQTLTKAKRSSEVTDSQVVDELAALERGRLFLAQDASREEGRRLLAGIVYGGRFVNLEAALVLFRTSRTPEEKKAALDTVTGLIAARPELTEIFRTQLAGDGVTLPANS